ncbi:MAG TPA: SUMF1/EgtB/PvdO family nonheme iron enzyme [Sedimentisphaerales bacterium]|nr:SUMF1/EgtB/PvdO family nonheme iron enzyme [Sedimentisphaerales bacterium]
MMKRRLSMAYVICFVIVPPPPKIVQAAEAPIEKEYTNSIGMKFVRIEPGRFTMGFEGKTLPNELLTSPSVFPAGDFDEHPAHEVEMTKPFYMGMFEVTNAQYELFDPLHREFRGKLGFSKADNEAVVFVNWYNAVTFCKWLSEKEGLPYRLPTEAEWEYCCRAGTTSVFSTGETLPKPFHKNVIRSWYPDPRTADEIIDPKWVNRKETVLPCLTVGQTPANPWGLYDMHGNVEEWCYGSYGPYEASLQVDPVGRAEGNFKVTRGGSHSTELYYLRCCNRMGTLPEDRSWYVGFRIVLGEMRKTKPLPEMAPQRYQLDVKQEILAASAKRPDANKPYFKGPRPYVKIPPNSKGPLFSNHNHDPAIVECPNGDLLAIWYSCVEEDGREVALAASRLRYGQEKWEPASPFWDTPDRNDHCPGLWFDGRETIYHFNGLSAAATWGNLAIILRTSKDNGVTWSRARLIVPEHGYRQMVGEPAFRTHDGAIVFGADAIYGSTIWISRNNGLTWQDPGGTLNGIHAGIVQLKDGRLMALGRGMNVDGMMPKSISVNMGKTWQASASPFPPLSGGQRMALMRLKEGPLFLASFADKMAITDASGAERTVSGLFGALSFDEGRTWPVPRLITNDGPAKKLNGGAWTGEFIMGHSTAEPKGYMSVCQTPDGTINLISSALHYQFNMAWLKTPMPALNRKMENEPELRSKR